MKCFLAAAVFLCGCGASQAGKPGAEAREPASSSSANGGMSETEIRALFQREAKDLTPQAVNDPQGAFTARVGAAGAPKLSSVEGASVIDVPLGTDDSVTCQLFTEEVDPGGTLNNVLKGLRGKVEPKQAAPWAVRVMADAPAAFVSVIYYAKSQRGLLLGELKLAMHARPQRSMLCVHDEPGYKQTFEKVVTELAESLKLKQAALPPSYMDIDTAYIGQVPVGFMSSTLKTVDSQRQFSAHGLTMLSSSPTDLLFHDDISVETIDGNDQLLRGVWVKAEGGELAHTVKLEQVKAGTYRYEGQLQGKAVSGEIKTKDGKPLASQLSVLKRLAREGKKTGAFSVPTEHYSPDTDPTRLIEMKYFRSPNDPPRSFRFEAGNLKFSGMLDANGYVESVQAPLGAATLTFRRELQRGKL